MRSTAENNAYFAYLPVSQVKPNDLNPRKIFDPSDIEELANSFKDYGVIQPISVYPLNSHYVIICGERRWRAAFKANLTEIPAIVHPLALDNETVISMALIENMHRKDIDVLSESSSIRGLVENYGWSQAEIATKLGVSTGYVRNRYLLTKYVDIVDAFRKEEVNFSEAIELSTIDDTTDRHWFLEKLKNGDYRDFKHFDSAISRYKSVKSLIADKEFLKHPLEKSIVQFELANLPYCDQNCKHYLKLTWGEKRRFGIETEKTGWSEYCVSSSGDCYSRKRAAKERHLKALRKSRFRRPIMDSSLGSMLWYQYRKKMCRTCTHMVNACEYHALGMAVEKGIFAYCISPKTACYQARTKSFMEIENRRNERVERGRIEQRQSIISAATGYGMKKGPGDKLTKRECAYLIMQFIVYSGGRERLSEFSRKHSMQKNMPATYASQVTYLRNKLIERFSDSQLQEVLFVEAASAAAYVKQDTESLRFDRIQQKEIVIS